MYIVRGVCRMPTHNVCAYIGVCLTKERFFLYPSNKIGSICRHAAYGAITTPGEKPILTAGGSFAHTGINIEAPEGLEMEASDRLDLPS